MRLVLCLTVAAVSLAQAQTDDPKLSGPQAAPRVPEAATDIPIRAPGPATGQPSTGRPGDSQQAPTPGPLEPKGVVQEPSNTRPLGKTN